MISVNQICYSVYQQEMKKKKKVQVMFSELQLSWH